MVASSINQQTHHVDVVEPQLKRKRIRLKTERRREQCRANQARYRRKQLNHAKTLEETVQKLRADIPVLELQRNRLLYGGQQNVWNVVVEYFHVFRFGVPVTLPVESEDGTICPSERLENAETKHQLAFLRSSMTENVILGERSGVEALMEQWRMYSSSFQSLYFQLERVERTNDKFVSVTATLNVTVSEMTFQYVFPHLLDDGERDNAGEYEDDADSTRAYLRSKLLGQTTVNFMTPLMKELGNLSDVALVLENALITRDGAVGVRQFHN
ncbi:hypothetical protein PHMEG_0001623 [Phytophthora megakarya]|uniref:BZIP domain-containing protein n=1 Tax=Phytophthora megakarya TaxID=4795 RepID=A0A225X184_9STRA|nr:hypothetical protein PHMEG_0001623 [Phytophthora megakarya]